jgi:hypothetical protein
MVNSAWDPWLVSGRNLLIDITPDNFGNLYLQQLN